MSNLIHTINSRSSAKMNCFQILLSNEADSMRIPENTRRIASTLSFETCHHNPIWRRLTVQWCYAIIDSIKADRELVYIIIDILDRYLALQSSDNGANQVTDKKTYETTVMASMLLTTRLFTTDTCILCMKDLVKKSAASITINNIRDMAKDIYKSLTLDINTPTAARFARALVQLLPKTMPESSKAEILHDSIYQIELSVQDNVCMSFPPSLVAWMSVENALHKIDSISAEERCHFRTLVTDCSGHCHSFSLRNRLASFEKNAAFSDAKAKFMIGTSRPCLKPRRLRDIPVVSQTDIAQSAISRKRRTPAENKEERPSHYPIRRCKKTMCLNMLST